MSLISKVTCWNKTPEKKERANQGEESEGEITKDGAGVQDVHMEEDGEKG